MKTKRLISLLLTAAMMLSTFAMFSLTTAAVETEATDSELQILGLGYDVTAGKELKRSALLMANPILDMSNPALLSSIKAMELNEQRAENFVAGSSKEVASQVGSTYAGGIGGAIPAVNLDISAAFDKSHTVQNAIDERYELYYMEILRRQIVIRMELNELRQYVSAGFARDAAMIRTEEDATLFLQKYGTHLFTGYLLGGRLTATNYQITNSTSVTLGSSLDLKAQLGAAASACSAGVSFSLSEKYNTFENSSIATSSYDMYALGGVSVQGMTLDHLFTFIPSALDGAGHYAYGDWVDSINEGVNLDVIDAATGTQAIPVWELLEQSAANSEIRSLLVRAYAALCGEKLAEYNAKYPYLNRDFSEASSSSEQPVGSVTEYYTLYGKDNGDLAVTGPIAAGRDDKTYQIKEGTSISLVSEEANVPVGEKSWRVIKGAENVTVLDDINGYAIASGGVGTSFTLALYCGDIQLDYITFNIEAKALGGGFGTEAEPYLISSVDHFYTLMNTPTYLTGGYHFLMTNNIDLSATMKSGGKFTITAAGIMSQSSAFNGTFDGGYYTIKGAGNIDYPVKASVKTDDTSAIVGLFGYNAGTIKNLRLEGISFTVNNTTTNKKLSRTVLGGVLVGMNTGTISNCVVKDAGISLTKKFIKETSENKDTALCDDKSRGCYVLAGGLVGVNKGRIERCGVINVTATANNDASSDNNITAYAAAGGLVGVLANGVIDACYTQVSAASAPEASSTDTVVSARVDGYNNIFTMSTTQGFAYVGGLVGWARAETNTESTATHVSNCVIDVPCQLYAVLSCCDKTGSKSKAYAGTAIGSAELLSVNEGLKSNYVLRAEGRVNALTATSDYIPATAMDGSGDGKLQTNSDTIGTALYRVQTLAYDALSGGATANVFSATADGNTTWMGSADNRVMHKSFYLREISSIGSPTINYQYGQSWMPQGISVKPVNAAGGEIIPKSFNVRIPGYNKYAIGNYSMTVEVFGKSFAQTLSVVKCDILQMYGIDSGQKAYYMGEIYDIAQGDLSVTGVLSNGRKISLLGEQLSYVNYPTGQLSCSSTPLEYGENKITLSLGALTGSFIVKAIENPVTEIEILQQPSRKTYPVGSVFSAGGMQVQATYKNGKIENVENNKLELIGTSIAEGENYVVISYGDYVTKSVSVTGFTPLSIKSLPTKTVYYVGDTIDWAGLVLSYTSNGTAYTDVLAQDCTVSATTVAAVGKNNVTLSHGGHAVTVSITGLEKPQQANSYLITFVGYGGTVLSSQNYEEGQTVTIPTPPSIPGYNFVAWDKEITVANADAIYTARYERIATDSDDSQGGTNVPTTPIAPVDDVKLIADIDGDGHISLDDAKLLLQYVHFTDRKISATGDVNGDGRISSDDAIYLKRYLLEPGNYPIGGKK